MFRLNYVPDKVCWIYKRGQPVLAFAVTQADSGMVRIYDSAQNSIVLKEFQPHQNSISAIAVSFFYTFKINSI